MTVASAALPAVGQALGPCALPCVGQCEPLLPAAIAEGADPIGMLCLAIVAEQLRPKNSSSSLSAGD